MPVGGRKVAMRRLLSWLQLGAFATACGTAASTNSATEKPDTTVQDIADAAVDAAVDTNEVPDAGVDISGACQGDSDCTALTFSACAVGVCKLATHTCAVQFGADGAACVTGGVCGGSGQCDHGACVAKTTCAPVNCGGTALHCGEQTTLNVGLGGPSALKGYGTCSPLRWDGPEFALRVINDSGGSATVTLTAAAQSTSTPFAFFDLYSDASGQCDSTTCDHTGTDSIRVGIPAPGGTRLVVLDTLAPGSGSITVSMACTEPSYCGDHKCQPAETCETCVRDCGACAVASCGNGTCDADENCTTCPADCHCPAGCSRSFSSGCGGCSCEACVCNATSGDWYCCNVGWDDLCAIECAACNKSTCPAWKDVCGDGICAAGEYISCPNDCIDTEQWCGDGICGGSDVEDCKECPQDCGFCAGAYAPFGCGDGWCYGGETCATCPADCGGCGDYACACKTDAACCSGTFDFACQTACSKCLESGSKCPVSACGDGVCAGETAATCPTDCKQ